MPFTTWPDSRALVHWSGAACLSVFASLSLSPGYRLCQPASVTLVIPWALIQEYYSSTALYCIHLFKAPISFPALRLTSTDAKHPLSMWYLRHFTHTLAYKWEFHNEDESFLRYLDAILTKLKNLAATAQACFLDLWLLSSSSLVNCKC